MKLTSQIVAVACQPKLKQDGSLDKTKEGVQKFVVAYEVEKEVRVANTILKSKEIETCSSLIEIKDFNKKLTVELNVFAIPSRDGKSAQIYYQIKSVL